MRSRPFLISARTVATQDTRRRWVSRLILAFLAVVGVGASITLLDRRATAAAQPSSTLAVTSVPTGITVLVDGSQRGRTPATVAVPPGNHQLTFRDAHVIAATTEVSAAVAQTSRVHVTTWLRTPVVRQLRPPFPGTTITDAGFLADGRVALLVALPPGNQNQLWVRNRDGGLQQLGPASAEGALVASPDGRQVAYLAAPPAQASDAADPPLTTVRLSASDGRPEREVYTLPAETNEQFADLSWSPDGRYLLLVVRERSTDSGTRTQLRVLAVAQGGVRTVVELPSAVVSGSFLWSPSGDDVAFLTRAGSLVSLCMLAVDPPSFHYLADLGQNDTNPLPVPPLAWSADGSHLVYAAPVEGHSNTLGGRLFGARSAPALFSATAPWTESRRLGAAVADAPVWRADGSLLALAQTNRSGPLRLESVDPGNGAATPGGSLPLPAIATYAVRWDADHGQALLAQRGDNGATAFWLLSFTPEVAR